MIQQRTADLERIGHTGSVDFGQNIVGEVRLHVQILNSGQWIGSICSAVTVAKDIGRIVTSQALFEVVGNDFGFVMTPERRHRLKVSFGRIESKTLKSRLCSQKPWSPIHLRIHHGERSEKRSSDTERENPAHSILLHIHVVSRISGETLVSSVAAQCDGHFFASHLADEISRQSRRVSEWLIVMP